MCVPGDDHKLVQRRGSTRDGRLWFPTLSQARALLAEEFVELDCHVPGYELGACFPTLRLAPRA